MKMLHDLLNKNTAQSISRFMYTICCIVIVLLVMMLVLSFAGRLQYNLSFEDKNYPNAIYSEENHNFSTRFLTVSASNSDDLRIRTYSEDGRIEMISYIALVLMYATGLIPMIIAYLFLARVFKNVSKGEIFVKKNAHYLLYYGIIQAMLAAVYPFLKLLIVQIANMITTDRISLSTGADIINNLIPAIGFLVAAYIINYGVNLQDEVDHTL